LPRPTPEDQREHPWLARSLSLTTRILAVNVIALGLLAGSLFYLDSYRRQLLAERFLRAGAEAEISALAMSVANRRERRQLIVAIGDRQKQRLLILDRKGAVVADNFALAKPTFELADPDRGSWFQRAARTLDRGVDFIVGADEIPDFPVSNDIKTIRWEEVHEAIDTKATVIRNRKAPDGSPVITAATRIPGRDLSLLTISNARDITQTVRDARQTLAIVVGAALIVSILLSLFLARTIVQPLRTLVRAAVRVRLGRDREVVVPRLPDRRDEIGFLARAVSDMTAALRQRIDAVESFAADVAHELKNPLASLRSALEALEKVEDTHLRRQLTDIAAHDVRRIDRLVTEIAEASRIDAELSRSTFAPVDIERLVTAVAQSRERSGVDGANRINLTRRGIDWSVRGDEPKLERVLENLLDNAVSFSAPGDSIEVTVTGLPERIELAIADHGPGIPADEREKVFARFHSHRPEGEDFGSHSGLGLAIAKTIVEAHDGTLTALDRPDGKPGACLMIVLPRDGRKQ
jgi:two-component system sensor histidine kinase ChvG